MIADRFKDFHIDSRNYYISNVLLKFYAAFIVYLSWTLTYLSSCKLHIIRETCIPYSNNLSLVMYWLLYYLPLLRALLVAFYVSETTIQWFEPWENDVLLQLLSIYWRLHSFNNPFNIWLFFYSLFLCEQ